jgi:hypothetical protein
MPPRHLPGGRTGYVPPLDGPLQGFPGARRVRPRKDKNGRYRARWRDDAGMIFEWDYQHGTVEMYNRRGEHLGEFDPVDGRRLKPGDPTRRAQP